MEELPQGENGAKNILSGRAAPKGGGRGLWAGWLKRVFCPVGGPVPCGQMKTKSRKGENQNNIIK